MRSSSWRSHGSSRFLALLRRREAGFQLSTVYVLHVFEKKSQKTAARPLGANMAIRVRKSSGNVFRDIGFGSAEAENLRVRSLLMIKIERLITSRGWTQSDAAKALGVTQPRLSDLVRGKLHKFSADTLIEMLGRAGVEVTITTKSRKRVA